MGSASELEADSPVDLYTGDLIESRIENRVTGKPEINILQADPHILISGDLVQQVFDQPNEIAFTRLVLGPLEMYVIFSGRNRQVRYKLVNYRSNEGIWEADLVADSNDC